MLLHLLSFILNKSMLVVKINTWLMSYLIGSLHASYCSHQARTQCICTADCTLHTSYGQPLPSPPFSAHIYIILALWQVYREHKHSCFLCKFYHIRPYSLLQSEIPNWPLICNSLTIPSVSLFFLGLHTSPHFPTTQTFRN